MPHPFAIRHFATRNTIHRYPRVLPPRAHVDIRDLILDRLLKLDSAEYTDDMAYDAMTAAWDEGCEPCTEDELEKQYTVVEEVLAALRLNAA